MPSRTRPPVAWHQGQRFASPQPCTVTVTRPGHEACVTKASRSRATSRDVTNLDHDSMATAQMIRTKRAYEPPMQGDGQRILVERLWPRGVKKEALEIDAWMKDVAPSTELRKWFAHREDRWEEFQQRYRSELDAAPNAWKPLLEAALHGTVTLLYSAHDTLHNSAIVLRDYLLERGAKRSTVRAPRQVRRGAVPEQPRRGATTQGRRPSLRSGQRQVRIRPGV